jgi:hypothetical protein
MSRARKAVRRKSGPQRLLLAVVVALAIALLLLRLIVSLHPHRRREFRTGNPQSGAFEGSLALRSQIAEFRREPGTSAPGKAAFCGALTGCRKP